MFQEPSLFLCRKTYPWYWSIPLLFILDWRHRKAENTHPRHPSPFNFSHSCLFFCNQYFPNYFSWEFSTILSNLPNKFILYPVAWREVDQVYQKLAMHSGPILIIIFFSPSLVRTLPLSPLSAVCKHARWRLGGQLPLRREQGWQVTFPLFPLLEGLKDSMCFLFLQQSLVSPHVLSFLQKYSIDLTTCWVLTSCLKSPIHLDCRPISPFLKFLGKSTVFLFWIHAHSLTHRPLKS